MNIRSVLASLTIVLLAGWMMEAASETLLYVSPGGNDGWSGSSAEPAPDGQDGPLATVAGARDRVRALRAAGELAGPVRVLLREGVYRIEEALVFGPEDGGTFAAPVTYAAFPGEQPVVSGGKTIDGWTQEGPLWVCQVDPEKFPESWFSALWVDGEYRHRARTPNEGFFCTAGKAEFTGAAAPNKKENPNGFLFTPGNLQAWNHIEDALVVAMHSWDVTYFRIQSLDMEKNEVRFTASPNWPFENWGPKQRYFVENVFEALDAPGEWYLDRTTHKLYYFPMPGEELGKAEIVAPVAQQLVRIEGNLEEGRYVEFLNFEGISFQHTDFPLGPQGQNNAQAAYPVHAAIQGNGARYCSVSDCEIGNISNYALWFEWGCQHNRIAGNHMHAMGAGGVRLGSGGNPATPNHVTAWNEVDNNWIHDGGQIFQAAVGVWIGRSSYNTVSHNDISDLFYTGVSVGWSWGYAESSANHNLIEFNHIHHLGKRVLSDMGGIYALGLAPGTILRNNLIHDVYSYAYGGWGIYPDEGSTDLLIENNVVYHTKTGGFHQHYGRENRVVNNVFAFSEEDQIMRTREEEHISFFFEHNIVLYDNGRLLGSNWKNGNFRMDQNCYWDLSGAEVRFKEWDFDAWRGQGHDVRSIIADPLFVDAAAFDFRLKPQSPALQLGFRPIDASQAGLYGDTAWVGGPKSLPRVE